MQTPQFPECNHLTIKSLFRYSDQDLLTLFQRYPEQGKYFVALFCRYNPIVYTLIAHSARSPVQGEYLFALTWRHAFYEMRTLELRGQASEHVSSFQNWLINVTAMCINQVELPPVETITYNLESASPPLWCYLEQALDRLPPIVRLILIMAKTFKWSPTRIAAYLQAEGDMISPAQVQDYLNQSYTMLTTNLPEDIRAIYLGEDEATAQMLANVEGETALALSD
ncbi:MAG: sigma-70 family RNA polymerase sigma factor [Spirulina sp. SIO3F2]|nr:sigma-70 family RNA polymerase sigma factor [Spirulina sp. SIO3F2]